MWQCPSCQDNLVFDNGAWRCASGHSYDQAKEGYVNLLLAHQKRSRDPGDNKDMVRARREYLQQGHYQPLAEALAKKVAESCMKDMIQMFDAGCGEGYYLAQVRQYLLKLGKQVQSSGIDISKFAVQKAAKKYSDSQFAVASSFHIPVPDASQDTVLQVFAPSDPAEVRRILQPGGCWIKVDPAPAHLQELKSVLYDVPAEHVVEESQPAPWLMQDETYLQFDVSLSDRNSRLNLLKMTPFFWSATPEAVGKVEAELTRVTAAFHIKTYAIGEAE